MGVGGIGVTNTGGGHALDGTFLVSDLNSTAQALASGDWVAAGLMGVADGFDVAATVSDPFGSLLAAGAGWLMDHFDPLKKWLDDLTGDSQAVDAFAGRWEAIATQLGKDSEDLRSRVRLDLGHMQGLAIAQYTTYVGSLADTVDALKEGAEGVASALKVAATLVDVVHGIVRDTIAQLVGAALSWVAEETFSLGFATGWVVEQVTTRVSSLAAKIGGTIKDLVESCKSLETLVTKLDGAVGKIREFLDLLHPDAARGAHTKPWLHDRTPSDPTHVAQHRGTIKSIPDRFKDVGTTEVPINVTVESTVGDSHLAGSGGDDDDRTTAKAQ